MALRARVHGLKGVQMAVAAPRAVLPKPRCRGLVMAGGTPPRQLELTTEGGPDYSAVQRNLALEIVRVTEAAALASGRWLGKGDKNAADQAAVDMMRKVLNSVSMDGVVVIGEGEKDEAPMLYAGERIGDGSGPAMDIAVDPLDGTSLTAQGRNGAVSVIAVAARGALFDPGPVMYMEKLAVGPEVPAHLVSLDFPVERNLQAVARALRKPITDVTVIILDRPRHKDLIAQVRAAGARIRMISDGDVGGAIEVAKEGGPVDIMMGIGGTPEGVIAAAALKCMGGSLQGRLWPRNEEETRKAKEQGYDVCKILTTEDLCKGDDVFFAATGVSDSDLLKGVRYFSGGAATNSIVMRCASGTVRFVETYHRWAKPSVTNIDLQELTSKLSIQGSKELDAEIAAAVAAAASVRGVNKTTGGTETVLEYAARTGDNGQHTTLPLHKKSSVWGQ